MLLEVIEVIKESIQNTAIELLGNPAGHTQSQKTADDRKEGMLHGKIISSHLMGKAVNNYSQFWK